MCSLTFKNVGNLKITERKRLNFLSVPRRLDHKLYLYITFCEQNVNCFVVTSIPQVLENALTIQRTYNETPIRIDDTCN